jgi:hypothetical protein
MQKVSYSEFGYGSLYHKKEETTIARVGQSKRSSYVYNTTYKNHFVFIVIIFYQEEEK